MAVVAREVLLAVLSIFCRNTCILTTRPYQTQNPEPTSACACVIPQLLLSKDFAVLREFKHMFEKVLSIYHNRPADDYESPPRLSMLPCLLLHGDNDEFL